MKSNNNIQQHLQQHYQNLSIRLTKAQMRGRSQNSIQQLQGRLQRCAMQLKQLGVGVAVLAALGWSTPALGQQPLPFGIKSYNPFDTIYDNVFIDFPEFVDLDNDGDMDMMTTGTYFSKGIRYYKNMGWWLQPYSLQVGANDPFPTFTRNELYSAFVDVDGDGDLDMFATPYDYYLYNAEIYYYENTGLATQPNFTLRLNAADNPLSDAVSYLNSIIPSTNSQNLVYLSFVDIDDDGDADCFITFRSTNYLTGTGVNWPSHLNSERILYYKNNGTATVPNFQRQVGTANPLNSLALALPNNEMFTKKLLFVEGSQLGDGDWDVFGVTLNKPYYYENIGSSTAPVFSAASYDILDGAYAKANITTDIDKAREVKLLGDADKNGRLEVLLRAGSNQLYLADTTIINLQRLAKAEAITVHPNPTTGLLQLEQPLTGTAYIYNAVGQKLYTKELEQDQQLDIIHLPQGTYFLYIRTKEQDYQQTIIVQE